MDPDGEVPIFVVTALIGAGVSGITAVIEGKSASEVLAATLGGAVDGAIVPNAGSAFATKGIKNFGDRVIKSDATKRQLEKMFKTEAKNQGKKIKNKELSKKLEKFNSIAADSIIDFNNEIYGDDR